MLNSSSGDALAESYVSFEEYKAYAQAFGWQDCSAAADIEAALRRAAMAVDLNYVHKGFPASLQQARAWPRAGVVLSKMTLSDDVIPQAVKSAQIEMARLILSGLDPFAAPEVQRVKKKREKLDVLEEETEFEATGASVSSPIVDSLLDGLAYPKGGQSVLSVQLTRV